MLWCWPCWAWGTYRGEWICGSVTKERSQARDVWVGPETFVGEGTLTPGDWADRGVAWQPLYCIWLAGGLAWPTQCFNSQHLKIRSFYVNIAGSWISTERTKAWQQGDTSVPGIGLHCGWVEAALFRWYLHLFIYLSFCYAHLQKANPWASGLLYWVGTGRRGSRFWWWWAGCDM